jgi:deoxyadenosine kinase
MPSPEPEPYREPSFAGVDSTFNNVFIGISGLIGAGKSTLATALAKELNLPVYYEPVQDNVYLEDFYSDMKKFSFPMQVHLLNKRFEQQQQVVWSGKGGVQDRTIYEDSVFARMLRDTGLMEKRDYDTYQSLFNHMSKFMSKPNVIVHLDLSPEESMRRIKMRARDCETSISLEYLQGLYDAYESFLREIARVIPVIKINYEKFRTVEEMATAIKQEYEHIQNIRYVDFAARSEGMGKSTTPSETKVSETTTVPSPKSMGKSTTPTKMKVSETTTVPSPSSVIEM